ncbi:MAG: phytoene desaturase family protein [Thermoflexales bacterium]|nr:phytoene desaturase family protein [Thermoflexales bacterium]
MLGDVRSPSVIVIGAGIGGLSAAIALAARGFRVTVLEKLDRPGGKMGEVRAEGFRWDSGPSVITMRPVYERLFRAAGRDVRDYVEFVPLRPVTRYFWRDGVVLDAVTDEDEMAAAIERQFGKRDAEGYRRFMQYARRLHDIVAAPFLYRHKPTLRDLVRLPIADVLKIDALRTMHQAIRTFFDAPHLVQLFCRFATYNGSSPYRAPATLNVIAHVEMAQGAWYPRGGVFQLARAYERLACELGVEVRYSTPAAEILVTNGTAVGVRTAEGQTLNAEAVVCNVDYTFARQTLLPSNGKRQPLEPSCSGFVLLLGVRGRFDALAHHNIFFTDDYPCEFADIFDRCLPPSDPTLYLCVTSKTDPEHAPPGYENWFVLVNAPYLSPAFDWRSQGEHYAEHIKAKLMAWLERICGVHPEFVVERRLTPQDLQDLYGGHRGAIYGFSSNTRLAAFARPNNRDPQIRRLYFASGSVHPGGGVPLVTLSGLAAARCIEEDLC